MQRNDMVEKRRVYIDGVEIPGFVYAGELKREKGRVDVPEFKKKRKIQDGITTYPEYELRYKISRDTSTLKFFRNWFDDNENHDVTIIRTDAHGSEFERVLLSSCECIDHTIPEADLSSPTYAQVTVIIAPWEITPIDI